MMSRSSSSKGLVRDGVRRSLWAVVLSTLTFFMSMLLPSLMEMQHALENRRDMITSGALCGFAGFLAVSAVSHTLSTETAGGRGFTAIIVAWLAKMNPFVMILISALLSFLDKGAVQIASDFGLNEYVSKIISGVILFFILGSEFFINYQVKAGGKHK